MPTYGANEIRTFLKQKCSKALFEQWNFILNNIDLEFRLSAAIVLTNTLIAEYANFQDGYTST